MSEAILSQILAGLNRIESKVDANHQQISTRLDEHMHDEEQEIEALMEVVQSNREESDRRHTALLQSLSAYHEGVRAMEGAFLRGADGKPDYPGHHDDHHGRKKFWEFLSDARNRIMLKVIEWAGVGVLMWMLFAIWQALLKGPAP